MTQLRLNRRQFLQTSAAATSAFAAPYFVPASAFGANERIVTGHIGVGGQGGSNLSGLIKLVSVAAVCDLDAARVVKAIKTVAAANQTCEGYKDYRQLLDRKDIDAVVVCTPDHWHALATINACDAGKDVYCEKPLSLTIVEGRKMVEAARRNKRIVQTGSQQRSSKEFRTACELVRNGYVGKLEKVLVGIPGPNHPGEPVPDSDPPADLDYEMWLGPAPFRPYNAKRVHYFFRFWKDYSGGQLTNFGAHHIDIAQWAMGMDESGPIKIEGTADYHPKKWHEVTEKCRINHTYASGVVLTVGQGQADIPQGATFIGSAGRIHVTRGKITSDPGEILMTTLKDTDTKLYRSDNHHKNFVDCIKSRELPICDVEIGHRSATCCHLSNIAAELGRPLNWDPKAERFVNDEAANKHIERPYRAPWKLA